MTGTRNDRRRARPGERKASMAFRSRAAAACFVVSLLAAGRADAVALRATAGFSRIAYGDYNAFADGINAIIAADPTFTGELGNMHWLPEIGVEASVPLVPALSLGAGAGLIWGSSSFEFSAEGETLTFEHTVKAYPLTVALRAEIPAPFVFARPYVFAGGGAYYVKLTFEERLGGASELFGYDAELSSWGFGMHGGVGFSFTVAPTVSVDLGFMGRYAKITGFEGTATSVDGETADIALVYYEDDGNMVYGPESVEAAAGLGEGAVDLSGYGISLGVHVSF